MGQLWDRLRRFSESYVRDFDDEVDWKPFSRGGTTGKPSYQHTHFRDPEEERLAREIDELTRQQGEKDSFSQNHERQREPVAPKGTLNKQDALAALGLPSTAGVPEIKRAYKQLMLLYHPDRVAGLSPEEQKLAEKKAQQINQAYQTLKQMTGF